MVLSGDGFIWSPPSLSELTLMLFNTGLTPLGLDASILNSYVLVFTFDEFHMRIICLWKFYCVENYMKLMALTMVCLDFNILCWSIIKMIILCNQLNI